MPIADTAVRIAKKPDPHAQLITPHEQLKAYCTCNRKNLCGALMAFVNVYGLSTPVILFVYGPRTSVAQTNVYCPSPQLNVMFVPSLVLKPNVGWLGLAAAGYNCDVGTGS